MSGHRWCIGSLCCVVTVLQAGCQSDGSGRMAWNPLTRRAEKAAVSDESSFSFPKFARRKAADEESSAEKSVPLIAEGRLETLLEEGQLALQGNRLDDACKAYTEILSAAPDNATAHHGMAMASDLSQQWADAEYHYKQALRIRPRDANLLCDTGYSYVLQNRFSEASRYLNQAIEVNPQHESAQMNLALLDLRQGNRAAAEARIVQRFGSSATATQVMAQLESRLAAAGSAVTQASASSVIAAEATLEQVQALAARERAEAELRRANQRTQFSDESQMPAAAIPPTVQPPAIVAQYADVAAQSGPSQPPAAWPGIVAGPDPATSSWPLNATTPGNWNSTASGHLPNSPLPNSASMTGQIVPVYPSGAFQTPPATGVSYGQPMGFGLPPGQIAFNNVSATIGLQNGGMSSSEMQGASTGNTVPRVQLEGLNVGPGALFPIGRSPEPGGVSGLSANGTGFNGAPVNGSTMTPVQSGTRGGLPAGDGSLQMGNVSAPGTNSMINGTMYTQPMATLPAQEWAMRQQQIQQSQSRFAPGTNGSVGASGAPSGAWPSAQPPQTNPLAGYERQLQQIDNQYNNALQQMDGRSQPNVLPARY